MMRASASFERYAPGKPGEQARRASAAAK